MIARCAATESNDGATFPLFIDFLRDLAREKPIIALKLLEEDDPRILNFLAAILSGLSVSNGQTAYNNLLQDNVAKGQQLIALVQHMRSLEKPDLDYVEALLHKAMEQDDRATVGQCLAFAVERHDAKGERWDIVFELTLAK